MPFPLAHGARNRLTTATSATSGTANFSTGLIHAVGDKPEVCHTAISLSRCRRVSTIMMEINKVSDSTTPNDPSVAKPTMAKMASEASWPAAARPNSLSTWVVSTMASSTVNTAIAT